MACSVAFSDRVPSISLKIDRVGHQVFASTKVVGLADEILSPFESHYGIGEDAMPGAADPLEIRAGQLLSTVVGFSVGHVVDTMLAEASRTWDEFVNLLRTQWQSSPGTWLALLRATTDAGGVPRIGCLSIPGSDPLRFPANASQALFGPAEAHQLLLAAIGFADHPHVLACEETAQEIQEIATAMRSAIAENGPSSFDPWRTVEIPMTA
ncbi:hypothetical protein JYT86_00510 [bacterium AH-315-N03]|nr:hypothetical protein [bacterium AH-315-N03]